MAAIKADYFYGNQAMSFSFIRIPRILIRDKRFDSIGSDGKIMYGMLLDRMSLSMKNGWVDKENRVYIVFTVDDLAEQLNVSDRTVSRLLKLMDVRDGLGLIERKKRGIGRPDVIYVKNFFQDDVDNSIKSVSEPKICQVKTGQIGDSRGDKLAGQESPDFRPNYTDNNYTENSYTEQNNNPYLISSDQERDEIRKDRYDVDNSHNTLSEIRNMSVGECRDLVKKNIEYDVIAKYHRVEMDQVDEMVNIMVDTILSHKEYIMFSGERYPQPYVANKLLELNSGHIEYVLSSIANTSSEIKNVRKYILVSLFNAPDTISNYYVNQAMHDIATGKVQMPSEEQMAEWRKRIEEKENSKSSTYDQRKAL